jgi:hypothetical protein
VNRQPGHAKKLRAKSVHTRSERILRIWCLAPDQWDHIRPVEQALVGEAEFHYDTVCDPRMMLEARPDLALCVNEFRTAVADCLHAARSMHIPTLLLQDGILEWRCQYENPLFGSGGGPPQHQPVLSDKIACLGEQSARLLRSWGNQGKIEVTGMPRLDHLLTRPIVERSRPGRCVLVATAKNPGFTPEQREITARSLRDVANELKARPEINVLWRISPAMTRQLNVSNQLTEFSSSDFASTLEKADALITTPSTSMLEAMLLERPVAMLDYHNVPRFVPTVWTISAREHIGPVLDDLLRCPANKSQYQRCLLSDCLASDRPAAYRVAELIRNMVPELTQNHVSDVSALRSSDTYVGANGCELAQLYPGNPIFQVTDVQVLQAQIARLQSENRCLQRELRGRSFTNGLFKVGRLISGRLAEKR